MTNPVANLIADYASIATEKDEKLSELVDKLHVLIEENPRAKKWLKDWIQNNGPSWLRNKTAALGAVIETAAMFDLNVGNFFAEILENNDTSSLLTVVATQRVRLLPLRPETKDRLYGVLRKRLRTWMAENKTELAVQGLISLPYVGGKRATGFICRVIRGAAPELADAATLGTLDWSCGCIRRDGKMDQATAGKLYSAVLLRLRELKKGLAKNEGAGAAKQDFVVVTVHGTFGNISERLLLSILYANLHWVLGALTSEKDLDSVCTILAHAFTNPIYVEDAGAMSAGRILLKRFGNGFTDRLRTAFGKDRSSFERMCECVARTNRRG